MLSPEEKKIIQEFNSNVRWLRQWELKEECTASASDVMKITGWTRERLRGERKRKTIRFKKKGNQCWYGLSSLPSVYFSTNKIDSQTANTPNLANSSQNHPENNYRCEFLYLMEGIIAKNKLDIFK